jgi:hypothetical protein
MEKEHHLQFFLLRYAPNSLIDRFMNIGIVLIDPNEIKEVCDIRFINWRRVRMFDKDADITMLRAIATDIEKQLKDPSSREQFLDRMEDTFSNVIQLSPRCPCVTENPATKLKLLSRRYLENV